MEYRNMGKSGLKVSAVGLGCNNFAIKRDAELTKASRNVKAGEWRLGAEEREAVDKLTRR